MSCLGLILLCGNAQAGFQEVNAVGDKRAHYNAPSTPAVPNKITAKLSEKAKYHAPKTENKKSGK